eukprot:Gregarina_sp_Poly_1__5474@NODE_2892_length_1573_cov_228_363878_g1828_i0_p3_GENE_NODE_2892_length_1573_cov_228_363878_g1828_i0NODE_2892_length_1573_cov_228_363878_g1828_i0_p3_ORF_typecomplete_len117_score12_05_NODE_2892_length_1573_cov_228_363878_g1828_i0635985
MQDVTKRWIANVPQPTGWPARAVSVPQGEQLSPTQQQQIPAPNLKAAPKHPVIYTPTNSRRVSSLSFSLPPCYAINEVPLFEGQMQVKYSNHRTTWQSCVAEVERAMVAAYGSPVA